MQLNVNSCREAIVKSFINADNLMLEASLLEKNGIVSRPFVLYHFALEEMSKCFYCITILVTKSYKDEVVMKVLKKLFKDHKHKLLVSSCVDNIIYNFLKIPKNGLDKQFIEASNSFRNKISEYDILKNCGLYTTYVNNTFKNPEELISLEIKDNVKFYAQVRFEVINFVWSSILKNWEETMDIKISQTERQIYLQSNMELLKYFD